MGPSNATWRTNMDSKSRDLEFYDEQSGVVTDALHEALVSGLRRTYPDCARHSDRMWDFDGGVYVRGKTKVDVVQVKDGVPTTVVIESGIAQPLKIRNPWPGQPVDVVAGKSGAKVVDGVTGSVITFKATAATNYLVERHGMPTANQRFESVSGTSATSAKKLGPVQLGLFCAGQ